MLDKTIVAWDNSAPAQAALDWALARAAGALTMVRVTDRSMATADYFVADSAVSGARQALLDEAERVRALFPGLDVDAELLTGDPIEELRRLSGPNSLVVVGTHKRKGPTLRYEWSVGARLSGSADGPIAIIPEEDGAHRAGVVVGVDGSEAGDAALDFAAAEAARTGQELRVVHAWQEPLMWQEVDVPDLEFLEALEDGNRRLLDDALTGVVARYPELPIERLLVRGPAQWALLDAARGAALLVVGNHGLRGVKRLLLGSVSHSIVLNIQSPTVVVSAPARSHD